MSDKETQVDISYFLAESDSLREIIADKQRRIERLEAALKFYANCERTVANPLDGGKLHTSVHIFYEGKGKAREALKGGDE